MKKTISIALVWSFALSLFSACGSTEVSQSTETPMPTNAQEITGETTEDLRSTIEVSANEPINANSNVVSMPLTEAPVSFTYFMNFNPQAADYRQDMSDNLFYATMEERSGVHIDFTLCHPANYNEQFSLQIASGDYSDMYSEDYCCYAGGFDKAVEEDIFLDLTPYVQEYAPNYMAIVSANEQNTRDAYTDDGRIVCFASAFEQGAVCKYGPMIRADWAEEFGMKPEEINTYEEYEAYIEAAYNAYGATIQLPQAGVPSFGYLSAGYDTLVSFGNAMNSYLPYIQIDGKVYSGIETEGFQAYLSMIADWYVKGWIYSDFMSEDFLMQGGADLGMVTSGASSLWWSEKGYIEVYQEEGIDVAAIQDATMEEGDVTHLGQTNYEQLSNMVNVVISSACTEPEIAIEWIDYRYSEEGEILANWGIEGVSYEIQSDGSKTYTDLICDNAEGMPIAVAQFIYLLPNAPTLTDCTIEDQGMSDEQLEAPEIWMTNKDNSYKLPDSLTMTTAESDEYNTIASDIITYGMTTMLEFIIGSKPISELDSFVSECQAMKLATCTEIQQAALDRYYAR